MQDLRKVILFDSGVRFDFTGIDENLFSGPCRALHHTIEHILGRMGGCLRTVASKLAAIIARLKS